MTLDLNWRQMAQKSRWAYPADLDVVIGVGQSLETGVNAATEDRRAAEFINRTGIKMLTGLTGTDGGTPVPVFLHGPLTRNLTATHATAITWAAPAGNIPACFHFSVAVDAWRKRLGRPIRRILCQSVGIPGQSWSEMDDDSPLVTGVLGPTMINNTGRVCEEVLLLSPAAAPLALTYCQGEADVSQTIETYAAGAGGAIGDQLDRMQLHFGSRPPAVVFQTGGYRNSIADAYGPTLAQVGLAETHGVFGGPIYPSLLHDDVHPKLTAQMLFAEVGAFNFVRHEMGDRVDMTPEAPQVVGNQVTVPFRTDGKSLAFDTGKYDAYGGLNDHGIEVSGTTISSVTISGRALVITAAAALSGRTLSIAMQSQNMSGYSDGTGAGYAAHRSDIMEATPEDSLLVAGAKMKRFIPSCRWQF